MQKSLKTNYFVNIKNQLSFKLYYNLFKKFFFIFFLYFFYIFILRNKYKKNIWNYLYLFLYNFNSINFFLLKNYLLNYIINYKKYKFEK